MAEALFLTSDELTDLAEPGDYVESVREDYRQHGAGAPAEPRTKLVNAEPPGMLTGYLAVLPRRAPWADTPAERASGSATRGSSRRCSTPSRANRSRSSTAGT